MFKHKTLQTSPLKTSSVGYINMKGWGTLILQMCMLTAKLQISDFQLVISVAVWRGMDKNTLNVPVRNKVCLLSYLWNKFKIMTFIHWQNAVAQGAISLSVDEGVIGVLGLFKWSWSFGLQLVFSVHPAVLAVFISGRKLLSPSIRRWNFCLCKCLW